MTLLGLGKRLAKHLTGAKATADDGIAIEAAAKEVPVPEDRTA